MEFKGSRIAKIILENKNKVWMTTLIILKTYYKAIVLQTWHWCKEYYINYIDLCSRTQSPEMNTVLYFNLLFTKMPR